jgi:hypothetical protein
VHGRNFGYGVRRHEVGGPDFECDCDFPVRLNLLRSNVLSMADASQPTGSERRARERINIAVELKLEAPDQRVMMVSRTVDLSSHGAFVRTNRSLPVGAHVQIAFTRGTERNPLALDGEVVRSGATDGGRLTGIAIRFKDLTELDEALLNELIDRACN